MRVGKKSRNALIHDGLAVSEFDCLSLFMKDFGAVAISPAFITIIIYSSFQECHHETLGLAYNTIILRQNIVFALL